MWKNVLVNTCQFRICRLQVVFGWVSHKVHSIGEADTNQHILSLFDRGDLGCLITTEKDASAFGML